MLITLSVTCLASSQALAWTGRATWTTFLRAGPGVEYTVTDEVGRGAELQVLSCEKDWCRTRFEGVVGYVQAGLIAQAAPEPSKATPGEPCVEARRAGYGEGELLRYCGKQPADAPGR